MGGVGTTMGDIERKLVKRSWCWRSSAGGMIGDKLTGEADGDYASTDENIHARDVTIQLTILITKNSIPKVAGGDNPNGTSK